MRPRTWAASAASEQRAGRRDVAGGGASDGQPGTPPELSGVAALAAVRTAHAGARRCVCTQATPPGRPSLSLPHLGCDKPASGFLLF